MSGKTTLTLTMPNLSDEEVSKLSDWLEKNLSYSFPWMERSLLVVRGPILTNKCYNPFVNEIDLCPWCQENGGICVDRDGYRR